jgi:hypothetical protein
MGIFSSITSVLFGSSESQRIKAKKELSYNTQKALYPNEAKAVEELVQIHYDEALKEIIYILGNATKHHAHLTESKYHHVKNSPFIDRFIEYYAFKIFINAYSLGHQLRAGTADQTFQREIMIMMEDLNRNLLEEATSTFSSTKIAECFSIAASKAADLGSEAGAKVYEQGYIVVNR